MRAFLIVVVLLFAIPGVCHSHVHILECDPQQGAVVTAPPAKVRITFGNSVEPLFSAVEVFDGTDKKVSGRTQFLEDDTIMESELQENLVPGEYTVKWKCMSLDGHKQTGSYNFKIQ
jgi:methionine-rich copper-binding protein CopC